MCVSDNNKKILVSMDTIELLTKCLQMYPNNPKVVSLTTGCLLELSFHADEDGDSLKELMPPELGLEQLLASVVTSQRDGLEGSSEDAAGYAHRLLLRLQPKEPESVKEESRKHVMLSYSWGVNKHLVQAMADTLRKAGVEVWRDEEGSSIVGPMSGSVDDTMADAVDSSSTVVVCVSKAYKESANCKFEAVYANKRRKQGKLSLVFVMMDADYTDPDGWLGGMLGDALWYPLWGEDTLAKTCEALCGVISDQAKAQGGSEAAAHPPPRAPAVEQMTLDEVGAWLESEGFGHLTQAFAAEDMDGKAMRGFARVGGAHVYQEARDTFEVTRKADAYRLVQAIMKKFN